MLFFVGGGLARLVPVLPEPKNPENRAVLGGCTASGRTDRSIEATPPPGAQGHRNHFVAGHAKIFLELW